MEKDKKQWGGSRKNAGRPKNSIKSDKTEFFQKRCNSWQYAELEKKWEEIKDK